MIEHHLNATLEKKQDIESDFVWREISSQGICTNCMNRNDCNYLARASAPIHTCELYECGDTSEPGMALVTRPGSQAEPVSGEVVKLGLCVNCDNWKSCGFKKPVSGVWHCEEYC